MSDVLAAIAEPEDSRASILARFKESKGSLDRWQARDLSAMADAISREEDRLELVHRGRDMRATLRAVRRALEAVTA